MRLNKLFFLLCCCMAPLTGFAVEIHQEKSLYRNILVYEENGLRCMKFGIHDTGRQSCNALSDPNTLVLSYAKLVLGALYLTPSPKNILIIGLGGGTLPMALQKILPDSQIDSVEIDQAVVKVAKQFFDYAPGKYTHTFVEDGRVFVKHALRKKLKYDLVILDAFDNISVPEHMTTKDFLLEIRTILQPDGVLAANTFSSGLFHPSESATYAAAFGKYFNLKLNNRVILAKNDGLPSLETIKANADQVEEKLKIFSFGKELLLPLFTTEVQWPPDTRILTDQYSPANLLNGM